MKKKAQKGFSLVELLLVLGVLAILLVSAFIVYPAVRDRNQANTEVVNLSAISASISNLYASSGNYATLQHPVAVDARVFPTNMNATLSGAVSAWGGEVYAFVLDGPDAADAGIITDPNKFFVIRYTGVPARVCIGMLSGAAGNFEQILIEDEGGDLPVISPDITSQGGEFDPGVAAARCLDGGVAIKFIGR